MAALTDANMLLKNKQEIKEMNKQMKIVQNLFNAASGADGGSTFSGSTIGLNAEEPALGCEDLNEMYDEPPSGFYYIMPMCGRKSTRV